MMSWNWSGRATACVAALLVVSVSAGCGKQEGVTQEAGSAEVRATFAQELAVTDVTGVRVSVTGEGISTPITSELSKVGSAWQGTIASIPAGTGRIFAASAYNASGTVLYQGSSAPTSIASGAKVSVALTLQQVTPTPPYQNEPPVIDSVVVSSSTVRPGATLTLAASAHDPNGDALSYSWTAPAGTFSSPAANTTSWTAPTTEGVQRLRLEVTDAKGTSVSVSFDIGVQSDGASGGADVSIGFNTWPEVRSMAGTPSTLTLNGTVSLSVTAVDADGDTLSYGWSTGCTGSLTNAATASPSFTLTALPSTGRCSFAVTVSDGRGGQHSGTLILPVGSAPRVNVAPKVDTLWQSATTAAGGDVITVGLSAHDPEGKAVVFSWSAASGTLRTPRWTSGSSEVDWVAPVCFDNPVSITATVTDADGASVSHAFSVAPLDSAKCGPLAVTGLRNIHNIQADGSDVLLPADLSTVTIGAWVPTSDGSSFTYRAGTGTTNGTFLIPNVDRVPYFLQYGTTYLWTSSRNLDLSSGSLGRADAVNEPDGTPFTFDLNGLSPWQAADDVQLFSAGAGLAYFSGTCSTPYPDIPEGTTSLAYTMDYAASLRTCGAQPLRIEPSKGDNLIVAQMVSRTDLDAGVDGGLEIAELRRSVQLSSLAGGTDGGVDGGVGIVARGTMTALPTTAQSFDFRASQYDALALAAHPSASLYYELVDVGTLPRYSDYGQFDGYPDLAYSNNYAPGQGDYRVTLQYGNPYPTSQWQRVVASQATALVPFSVGLSDGGTSRVARYSAVTSSMVQMQDGVTQTLVPQVGPPRDVRLNGVAATGTLTGVGLTPVASWTVPSVGTPTRYQVRLYELYATATGGTSRTFVGTFYTTQTQFRLPPGFLVSGKSYMLQLYAVYEPGSNPDVPFISGPSYHYSMAFSGRFQP